jgi:hypothetical protein
MLEDDQMKFKTYRVWNAFSAVAAGMLIVAGGIGMGLVIDSFSDKVTEIIHEVEKQSMSIRFTDSFKVKLGFIKGIAFHLYWVCGLLGGLLVAYGLIRVGVHVARKDEFLCPACSVPLSARIGFDGKLTLEKKTRN